MIVVLPVGVGSLPGSDGDETDDSLIAEHEPLLAEVSALQDILALIPANSTRTPGSKASPHSTTSAVSSSPPKWDPRSPPITSLGERILQLCNSVTNTTHLQLALETLHQEWLRYVA